jgi:hypothetical protein
VIVVRFVMAVVFSWTIAPGLKSRRRLKRSEIEQQAQAQTRVIYRHPGSSTMERSEVEVEMGMRTMGGRQGSGANVPMFEDLEGGSRAGGGYGAGVGASLATLDGGDHASKETDTMVIRDPKMDQQAALAGGARKYELDGDPLKILMLVTCYSEGVCVSIRSCFHFTFRLPLCRNALQMS